MHLDNWLERFALDDQILAQSYEQLGDVKRSWLKKLIAHLYNYYGREDCQEKIVSMTYAQGLKSYARVSPWNLLVCVIGRGYRAANKVIAAIMPAIMAGTKEIVVVLEDWGAQDLPDQVLVGLELMGVENILLMDKDDITGFVRETGSNQGMDGLFCLDDKEIVEQFFREKNCVVWAPRPVNLAGLVIDENVEWNLDVLSWANPDLEFVVLADKKGDWPDNFHVFEGSKKDFWLQPFDVVFAPEVYLLKHKHISLGFGPGHESSWVWPELEKKLFFLQQIVWT